MKPLLALIFCLVPAIAVAGESRFFAMDTIARGGPETVVPMLKELGYAGLGGQAGDETMAKALEDAGLRFFNGYLTVSLDASLPALNDSSRQAICRMKNHQTVLWLAVQAITKDGKALTGVEGDVVAIAKLDEIADHASGQGVRIALYPHTDFWIEKVEDAVRLADRLNRPDVGVTFNLCHWLKVEGSERDPLPVLKSALPRLMFVTINGADSGDTRAMDWKSLIQPLGRGSYDVATFLRNLDGTGYEGPIGFQGYGIQEDPREVLTQTLKAWLAMKLGRGP